jgi:hypothetical protein
LYTCVNSQGGINCVDALNTKNRINIIFRQKISDLVKIFVIFHLFVGHLSNLGVSSGDQQALRFCVLRRTRADGMLGANTYSGLVHTAANVYEVTRARAPGHEEEVHVIASMPACCQRRLKFPHFGRSKFPHLCLVG